MKEVNKIKIGINQKINLGGYETRDYYVELEVAGFDKKSEEQVQEAIDFGRDLCLKNTSDYYNEVKEGLKKGVVLAKCIDKEFLDLEKKIDNSENEQQLRTLEEKIVSIKDKEMHKVMQKKFNLKLISLK